MVDAYSRVRIEGASGRGDLEDEDTYQTVLSVSETNLSGRGRLKEKEEASKDGEDGEVAGWSIYESGTTEKNHLQIQFQWEAFGGSRD